MEAQRPTDRIDSAFSHIDHDYYARYEDGTVVHQTSFPEIMRRMFRMLDPRSGHRVLEIGTGSGYSTALLSFLVGERGRVMSVDIDADMVERAKRLLRKDGRTNVRVVVGDGRSGCVEGAPYNRIIAWASAEGNVPSALVRQLASGGVIVCPLRVGGDSFIARFRRSDQRGVLEETQRIPGGFIPMTSVPYRPWLHEDG